MNPRHRRLLIPGLLLGLLVIVVVSALANKADAATSPSDPVSRIADPRITESSGLVVSLADDDLAYTVNDSGHASAIYAVEISTGEVVGSATPDVGFVDTEALSIDRDGTLWVADTGDNERSRTDVALYSLPEFGRRDVGTTVVRRYPLTYPAGPRDVEALVVDPRTDEKLLLTKGLLGGEVLSVPEPLEADGPNRVTALDATVPGLVTDAAFTPDGRYVVARSYSGAFVLDPSTWETVESVALPAAEQGETVAMEPGGRSFLVGSEGSDSPLHRIALDLPTGPANATDVPDRSDAATPPATDQAPPAGGNGFAGATWAWVAIVIVLLAAISVAATRARPR